MKCLKSKLYMYFQIIKVGVTVARYVTLKNCRPWVVHAYKNTKGRGISLDSKEEVDDMVICPPSATTTQPASKKEPKVSAISLAIAGEIPTKPDEDEEEMPSPSTDVLEKEESYTDTNSAQPQAKGDNSNTNIACEVEGNSSTTESEKRHNLRKDKGKAHVKTSRVEAECTPQPTGTYQRVRFLCVPWRKPEGTLNKPVFKMMLESLMFYIMSKPGISQQSIMTNYTSFNQPFLKTQLLEILEDLGAVEKEIIKRPVKASLFSKRAFPTTEATDSEDSIILYIPTKECVLRLGQFISYVCS